VTKTFYLAVEVLYSQLQSAQTFNGFIPATAGGVAFAGASGLGAATGVTSQSSWMVSVRAHRVFLP